MPTFDTPNSSSTYDPPSGAAYLEALIRGGVGADGTDGSSTAGGAGGAAGELTARIPTPDSSLTVYVGDDATGTAGAPSPLAPGGDGGESSYSRGGDGGGGGSPSALYQDGSPLAVGEGGGGGGGGGGYYNSTTYAGGGGGGGGRGGAAGTAPSADYGAEGGSPGSGSGSGGAGGDGGVSNHTSGEDGNPGGTEATSDAIDVTETTSTAGPVVEITAIYLPTPTNLTIDATDADMAALSWDRDAPDGETTDEDGVRVYQSTDAGSSWTQIANLAAGTSSYTATDLLNGQQYTYYVETYLGDETAESGTDSAITDLPDVTTSSITPIDASVEDQLTIPNPGVTNNGSYRLRYRESGTSTWTDWGTVAHDGPDMTITGLADGEQYDLAVRSETSDATGSYATVQEVTLLPAPTEVTVSQRIDGLELTFTDNADNEDRHRLERRTHGGWESVATVSPNEETISDPDPQWYSVSEYRVVAETEHTVASSAAVETIPIHDNEFYADLERGSDRVAIGPSELLSVGEITLEHTTPSAFNFRVAPNATDYQDYCLGDITLYYGGQRVFSGRLDSASQNRGTTTLKGEGRLVELERDTTVTSYQTMPAQDAIDDYVTNVPGNWTVHEPYVRTIRADETFWNIPSVQGFDAVFDGVVETVPVVIDPSEVALAQTCWFTEAENASTQTGSVISGSDYSGFEAVELTGGLPTVAIEFTPQYTLPGDDFEFKIRYAEDSFEGRVEIKLDGDLIDRREVTDTTSTQSIAWGRSTTLAANETVDEIPDLEAGTTHTFEIDMTYWANGSFIVDALAPHDTGDRLGGISYTWDETVDSTTGVIDGPQLFPDAVAVEAVAEESWHVPAATLAVTIDDTTGSQALALSPTGTDGEYVSASNTSSLTADFDAAEYWGTDVHVRLTLSRYGSSDVESPGTGRQGQTVSELTLTIDTDDLPLIEDELVTDADTWLENLQRLHERADARFVADHQADALEVESFRRGDPSLVQPDDWITDGADAVEVDRATGDYYNRIRAYPADPDSDVSPLEIVDTSEVDRVGEEIPESRTFQAESRDDLRQQARQALREGVAGDEFSGRISIVPTDVQPGYPYEPAEFDGALTNAEQVRYTLSGGDVSGQISFGSRRDLVSRIHQRTRGN